MKQTPQERAVETLNKIKSNTRYIILNRGEGYTDECIAVVAKNFKQANSILTKWARTAPRDGGYDKTDFIVLTYEQEKYAYSVEYTGRFDMTYQHSNEESPLDAWMLDYITYQYANEGKENK